MLAGTQGALGHRKKDRLFELIERMRLPTVFFAEGGGGRPGDTDYPVVSALDTRAFALWARLSGVVPRIAIVAGRCFAGNAVIAGSSDLIVATENISLGMGGPAMIAGGGLGESHPEEIGPIDVQAPNGVVDVAVADEAEAVAVGEAAARLLPGRARRPGRSRTRARLRESCRRAPPRLRRPQSIDDARRRRLGHLPARASSRRGWSPRWRGSRAGRSGSIANNPMQMAGAITSDGADKAARFMQLCDAYGIPILSLVDTPGMMVGPEAEATALVRHCSRLFNTGANLRVPLVAVVLPRPTGSAPRRWSAAASTSRCSRSPGRRRELGADGARRCGPARPRGSSRRSPTPASASSASAR